MTQQRIQKYNKLFFCIRQLREDFKFSDYEISLLRHDKISDCRLPYADNIINRLV